MRIPIGYPLNRGMKKIGRNLTDKDKDGYPHFVDCNDRNKRKQTSYPQSGYSIDNGKEYTEPTYTLPEKKKKGGLGTWLKQRGEQYKEYKAKAPEREATQMERLRHQTDIMKLKGERMEAQSKIMKARREGMGAMPSMMGGMGGMGGPSMGTPPSLMGGPSMMGEPRARKKRSSRKRKKKRYKTIRVPY